MRKGPRTAQDAEFCRETRATWTQSRRFAAVSRRNTFISVDDVFSPGLDEI